MYKKFVYRNDIYPKPKTFDDVKNGTILYVTYNGSRIGVTTNNVRFNYSKTHMMFTIDHPTLATVGVCVPRNESSHECKVYDSDYNQVKFVITI